MSLLLVVMLPKMRLKEIMKLNYIYYLTLFSIFFFQNLKAQYYSKRSNNEIEMLEKLNILIEKQRAEELIAKKNVFAK